MRPARNAPSPGRVGAIARIRAGGRLTANDVMAASGASYRQVDYWVREGLLRLANAAEGSGSTRAFLPEEVVVARALVRLSAGGITGPILRTVPALIRGRGRPAKIDDWTVVVDPAPGARLPTSAVVLVVRTTLDTGLAADA